MFWFWFVLGGLAYLFVGAIIGIIVEKFDNPIDDAPFVFAFAWPVIGALFLCVGLSCLIVNLARLLVNGVISFVSRIKFHKNTGDRKER